jgi:hypothetical protein
MALAPTLLTIKNVSVGVGLTTLAVLFVTNETGQRSPSVGLAVTGGNVPTISVQLGPTTDPAVGVVGAAGQIPFLERILLITTGLPDGTPEANDLTPTLVWQETPLPGVGLVRIAGLAPAVVGDTGQSIGVTTGSAVIAGLAPTVSGPAGQDPVVSPDKAEIAFIFSGPVPTLFTEMALPVTGAGDSTPTIAGLAPTLSFRSGWADVPAAGDPVWVDVPRV